MANVKISYGTSRRLLSHHMSKLPGHLIMLLCCCHHWGLANAARDTDVAMDVVLVTRLRDMPTPRRPGDCRIW